jgi:hypothetical protein
MNKKKAHMVKQHSDVVFGQFRVMFFLTNCKVAAKKGSTMPGTRIFACLPPTLEEYLSMA